MVKKQTEKEMKSLLRELKRKLSEGTPQEKEQAAAELDDIKQHMLDALATVVPSDEQVSSFIMNVIKPIETQIDGFESMPEDKRKEIIDDVNKNITTVGNQIPTFKHISLIARLYSQLEVQNGTIQLSQIAINNAVKIDAVEAMLKDRFGKEENDNGDSEYVFDKYYGESEKAYKEKQAQFIKEQQELAQKQAEEMKKSASKQEENPE